VRIRWLWIVWLLLAVSPAWAQVVWSPPGWSNQIGTTYSGTELVNIAGQGSSACTTLQLPAGDGQVSWYMPNPDQDFVVSVHAAGGAPLGAYALRVVPWHVEVREGFWQLMASARLEVGDALAIAITGGRVSYLRNGTMFYQSRSPYPPTGYPAVACVQFMAFGGWVSNLQVQGGWK